MPSQIVFYNLLAKIASGTNNSQECNNDKKKNTKKQNKPPSIALDILGWKWLTTEIKGHTKPLEKLHHFRSPEVLESQEIFTKNLSGCSPEAESLLKTKFYVCRFLKAWHLVSIANGVIMAPASLPLNLAFHWQRCSYQSF